MTAALFRLTNFNFTFLIRLMPHEPGKISKVGTSSSIPQDRVPLPEPICDMPASQSDPISAPTEPSQASGPTPGGGGTQLKRRRVRSNFAPVHSEDEESDPEEGSDLGSDEEQEDEDLTDIEDTMDDVVEDTLQALAPISPLARSLLTSTLSGRTTTSRTQPTTSPTTPLGHSRTSSLSLKSLDSSRASPSTEYERSPSTITQFSKSPSLDPSQINRTVGNPQQSQLDALRLLGLQMKTPTTTYRRTRGSIARPFKASRSIPYTSRSSKAATRSSW